MDIGAQLRTSREAQGISLALLAEKTRVQPRILAAIELNDLGSIPPKPFGRGFVRAYAHEVGLDPERTVHDYFGQFAQAISHVAAQPSAAKTPPGARSWLVPASAVAIVVLGAVFLFKTLGTAERGVTEDPVVGTAGVTAPRPSSAAGTTGTGRAIAPAKASAAAITIGLRAERACWVSATADGRRVVYQLMPAGSARTLQAEREIALRAGDAGAIRLTINGRDAGPFGNAGEVRNARITMKNAGAFGISPGASRR
jgi:cytoskeleton protein RodZ